MLNIAVLVSGGGTNLQAIIDAVESGKVTNTKIGLVISNKKDAYALTRAKNHGIDSKCISIKDFETKEDFGKGLLETLKEYKIDLVVLAGYLVILPKVVVDAYENRIINVHPSLIPAFCGEGFYGIRVHEEALRRGVKVTGATVHFVDGGCDSGPIIMQQAVEVKEGDTKEVLQRRVMEEAEWMLLPKAIDGIANGKIIVEDGVVKLR